MHGHAHQELRRAQQIFFLCMIDQADLAGCSGLDRFSARFSLLLHKVCHQLCLTYDRCLLSQAQSAIIAPTLRQMSKY